MYNIRIWYMATIASVNVLLCVDGLWREVKSDVDGDKAGRII